jgi:hypothetical protein
MEITNNFPGGNIDVLKIDGDTVYLNREVRDDSGYFYWAFCVKGAQGRKLRFVFPNKFRVGPFGAAVSRDLKKWEWSHSLTNDAECDIFTYSFTHVDECVYFAHDMVYSEALLNDFLIKNNITPSVFTISNKGRSVPCFKIGNGDYLITVTSRHHACESTGTYVLQGFAEGCIKDRPAGVTFLFVPFVDYDGVTDGDPGKNRLPYDHNRDYGDTVLYNETRKLREIADSGKVLMNFDFHSPFHSGGINDYPYLMQFKAGESQIYASISQKLKEATKNDAASLIYTGNADIPYGTEWNKSTTPNNKNYFLPRTIMNVSITMETPYFGLENNMFTQEKGINLGKHLYEAVYSVICEGSKR